MIEPVATGRKQAEAAGRSDPRPRRWSGSADFAAVKNGDKDKKYVLVYRGDEASMETYAERGYEVEICRAGGPMVGAGITAKPGEPVSYKGHVLMSISKEKAKDQDRYGTEDGQARGLEYYKEQDERMLDLSGGNDPFRGQGGNFMRFDRNDPAYQIGAPEPDFGI